MKMDILQTPNISKKNDKKISITVKAIMLHHTAGGTFQSNMKAFMNPLSRKSAHYLIGKKGECAKLAGDTDRTWHAGKGRELTLSSGFTIRSNAVDPVKGSYSTLGDDYCIGIMLVNEGDGIDKYSQEQFDALDELIALLRRIHGYIPVIDHKMYDQGDQGTVPGFKRATDMSANFPLNSYVRFGRYVDPAAVVSDGNRGMRMQY